jgi:hypothetical protein
MSLRVACEQSQKTAKLQLHFTTLNAIQQLHYRAAQQPSPRHGSHARQRSLHPRPRPSSLPVNNKPRITTRRPVQPGNASRFKPSTAPDTRRHIPRRMNRARDAHQASFRLRPSLGPPALASFGAAAPICAHTRASSRIRRINVSCARTWCWRHCHAACAFRCPWLFVLTPFKDPRI